MFVIASKRADFLDNWSRVFSKRGEVLLVKSLKDLCAVQSSDSVCLVMLDLALPGINGSTAISKIRQHFTHTKFLLGGIHFEPSTELGGIASGAVGCLDASLPFEECEKIINVVLQGGIWLSNASIPVLSSRLQNLADQKRHEKAEHSAEQKSAIPTENELAKLTKRERQVAELVGNGANNKTIARQLFITDRTVKAHLTSIYDKLNISDRLQLALHVSSAQNMKEPSHAA